MLNREAKYNAASKAQEATPTLWKTTLRGAAIACVVQVELVGFELREVAII